MNEEGKRQKEEGIPLAHWVIPRVEKAMPADFTDEPYLGLDDIEAHTTRLLGSKSAADMKSSAKRFYPGDVLYSRLRPYLNKVWLADRTGLCSAEFIVLPSNECLDGSFLKFRLNAIDFVSFANSLNAGDRPRVDFDQISAFCLPPFALGYQRKLVARIEELFSELDAGEESLRRARRQLGVYRQSLLKQAFEGKLTAPWRAQHPDLLESPDQLLARIQGERQARYQQQLKEWEKAGGGRGKPRAPKRGSDEVDSTIELDDLPDLPEEWTWVPCSDLFENISSSGLKMPQGEYQQEGIYPIVDQGAQFIGGYTNDESKVVPEPPPLIVFGDHTRVVKLLRQRFVPGADGTKILKTYPSVLCEHLTHFLRHAFAKDSGRGYSRHFQYVQKLPIPLCSLPEQQEIVRLLDAQFEVIEQNEREIDAALKRSEALRQSILKKAFTGQLVLQDPNDEPASVLLEKIREERKKMTNTPKRIHKS